MAKSKGKKLVSTSTSEPATATVNLHDIQQDSDLWYRIKVLLYDLNNVARDALSETRISSTTNELYISDPYFTETESNRILCSLTLVDETQITVQDAIHQKLETFFEKRRASGDARPCGPHDMIPVYMNVFGIEKGELEDERFLSRLRRSGLGDFKKSDTGKAKTAKQARKGKGGS